jgi:hypothetical protein
MHTSGVLLVYSTMLLTSKATDQGYETSSWNPRNSDSKLKKGFKLNVQFTKPG